MKKTVPKYTTRRYEAVCNRKESFKKRRMNTGIKLSFIQHIVFNSGSMRPYFLWTTCCILRIALTTAKSNMSAACRYIPCQRGTLFLNISFNTGISKIDLELQKTPQLKFAVDKMPGLTWACSWKAATSDCFRCELLLQQLLYSQSIVLRCSILNENDILQVMSLLK